MTIQFRMEERQGNGDEQMLRYDLKLKIDKQMAMRI